MNLDPAPSNTIKDLMEFFSIPERPVTPAEFKAFWTSCTDDEKNFYKSSPLV